MLALSFEDYEREVRTVLDGMLGASGFDVQEDILAIDQAFRAVGELPG